MRAVRNAIAALTLIALAACETTSVEPTRETVAWSGQPSGSAWSAALDQALRTETPALSGGSPRDIDAFCPGFRAASADGRRAFYVAFLAEVARIESGLNPSGQYSGASGRRFGLLPLSADAAASAGCSVARGEDLFDPALNLRCAAKALDRAVGQDGLLAGWDHGWKGAARLWPSLRQPGNLADLQAALNGHPYCAAPKRRPV